MLAQGIDLSVLESRFPRVQDDSPLASGLFNRCARALVSRTVNTAAASAAEAAVLSSWIDVDPGIDIVRASLSGKPSRLPPGDLALLRLAQRMHLCLPEVLAVALACDVERDPVVGRILAFAQEPAGGARPTLGLIAAACVRAGIACDVESLSTGPAMRSGLLVMPDASLPLPERAFALPGHVLLALGGRAATAPGVRVGLNERERMPLPASVLAEAGRYASGLGASGTLVLRAGDVSEARAVAGVVAQHLGRTPAFIEAEPPPGLTPWLHLAELMPVFVCRLGPGECARLPVLPDWGGPVLVVTGVDGSIESGLGSPLSWRVPIPSAAERAQLWAAALGEGELATSLGQAHRHASGRIAELGRLATQHAAMAHRVKPELADVYAASWHGAGLETLAQPITDQVRDDALVLTPNVRRELELLLARCRLREGLAEGLGPSALTRYRHGVRALFVGASGTGKTLAVSWLACRLGLPLYRVDMAAVTSKYIGETEKNLSDLLARAEASEVILFFDEADAMFGKRTEVRQANDRFANAQTNYLLTRIESYDGIIVLASNSRARFDSAFSRRLDQIVEFAAPGPEERRALWLAHLGDAHSLSPREINELAMACDLAGGHVRNAVLAAAVLARAAGGAIAWEHVIAGLGLECRKLGMPLPAALHRR